MQTMFVVFYYNHQLYSKSYLVGLLRFVIWVFNNFSLNSNCQRVRRLFVIKVNFNFLSNDRSHIHQSILFIKQIVRLLLQLHQITSAMMHGLVIMFFNQQLLNKENELQIEKKKVLDLEKKTLEQRKKLDV